MPSVLDEQLNRAEEGGTLYGTLFRTGERRVSLFGGVPVLSELWGADRTESPWQEEDLLLRPVQVSVEKQTPQT